MGSFRRLESLATPQELQTAKSWFDARVSESSAEVPFAFSYGGQPWTSMMRQWDHAEDRSSSDAGKTRRSIRWRDRGTGLEVRCEVLLYEEFPVVEWTLYLKNTGVTETPIISDLMPLDTCVARGDAGSTDLSEFLLYHHAGSTCTPGDYRPFESVLAPAKTKTIATSGGRSSDENFPYFNLTYPIRNGTAGMVIAIGWPGQWKAQFLRDDGIGLHISMGQELTHFRLHLGEEVRTPLIAILFWLSSDSGAGVGRDRLADRWRSQNLWRRWMLAYNVPTEADRQPLKPRLMACSSHQYGEMVEADEASQIMFIDRYLEERLNPDYWWMDAGWYPNEWGWPNTGTWEVDTKRFPRGLRAITDHAHSRGLQTLVWFEPERVTPGTWLYTHHPEWLLGKDGEQKLLDLGNPAAREWLTDHVDRILTEEGIDLYRQDFNMEPLPYWRANDTPERAGISEMRHVDGLLEFWDELRRRRPGLLIDTCASGGRRNDLETLRRAVPLWRSDYILEPVGQQSQTWGIALWIPYFGTGTNHEDAYGFRSVMVPNVNALWDVRRRDLDYDLIRNLVAQWRGVGELFGGDYYPLTPYSLENDAWIGWQFHRPDLEKGMVLLFRRPESLRASERFPLWGLDAESRYRIVDLDVRERVSVLGGDELTATGVSVDIVAAPGSAMLVYERITS